MKRPPRADARVVDPPRERRRLLGQRGRIQVRRPFGDVPANDGAAAPGGGFGLRSELLVDLDADDEPAVCEQAVEAGSADPLPRSGDDNASIHRGSSSGGVGQPGILRIGNEPAEARLVGAGLVGAGLVSTRQRRRHGTGSHGRGCSDLWKMARRRVVALDLLQLRVDRAADLLVSPDGAECPEAAADLGGRHVDRIPGRRDRDLLPGPDGVDDGDRPHQAVRVGMERPAEQHLAGTGLHNAPPVHDRHSGAEKSDHRKVVGDEEVGEIVLPLELAQEIQNLRLDRDVEGRDRFVEHDEAGFGRERARHRDALALPTGHLGGTATRGTRSRARRARAARPHAPAGRSYPRSRARRAGRRRSRRRCVGG